MVDRCLYCDGGPGDRIETREMMFGLRHAFVYRRCVNCRSLWLQDVPDDLSPYYGRGYYSMSLPTGRPIPAAKLLIRILLKLPPLIVTPIAGKRGFPIYLKWFQGLNVSPASRIADIGAGEGSLISRMARHGFGDVWGFDPFIAGDRDEGAAHLRRSSISDAGGLFDVVMFNHSLEHVARPVEALREAAAHLVPSGAILVRIPLAGTYAERHYGPNWMALDPPRHLTVPTKLGLELGASAAGLEVAHVFFDSLPQQLWGSEQYAKDIPLLDERGGAGKRESRMDKRRTRELNRRHDGDSAGFILVPMS